MNNTDATIGNAFDNQFFRRFRRKAETFLTCSACSLACCIWAAAISKVDSRTGAVNGARSDQANVTLDGLDDNDQTQG